MSHLDGHFGDSQIGGPASGPNGILFKGWSGASGNCVPPPTSPRVGEAAQ